MFFVALDMNAKLSVNKTITIAPIKAMLALDVISSKINKIFSRIAQGGKNKKKNRAERKKFKKHRKHKKLPKM